MKPIDRFTALAIALHFFICTCTESPQKELQSLAEKEVLGTVSDIFSILDSCELAYPLEAFPKRIDDVAISDSFIYTIGESPNYPVVKFDRSGNFIRYIGKSGKGPGEIPHNYWNKLDAFGNRLAILIRGENRIILYENDIYLREKQFEIFKKGDEMYIKDLGFADSENLMLICNAISKYHIHLTDIALRRKKQFYLLPPSASLQFIMGQSFYWGVQKTEHGFISHFVYPPNWIEFTIMNDQLELLKDYSDVNYHNFPTVDSTLTIEKVRERQDETKTHFATGNLCWLVKLENFYVGYYLYFGEKVVNNNKPIPEKEVFRQIFIAENGKIIFEKSIAPEDSRMMLPYNEHLIKYAFRKRGDDIKVVLYFLNLRPINDE